MGSPMRRLLGVLITATVVLVLDAPPDRAATTSAPLVGAASTRVSVQKVPPGPRGRMRRPHVAHRARKPVRRVVVTPSQTIGVTVLVIPAPPAVLAYALEPNYPNPFHSLTTIGYSLVRPSRVTIRVYSALGAQAATLINWYQAPGRYSLQWDGTNNRGRRLAPGVYLYRIEAGSFVRSHKLVIL